MAYDADAYLEAIERPRVRFQGEWHEGRPLSHPQYVRFLGRLSRLEEDEEGVAEMMEIFSDVIRQGFPELGDDLLDALPTEGVTELAEDFLRSQPGASQNGESPTTD